MTHVHLRNDSLVIKQSFMYTAPYVKSISIKCQYITILFDFRKLYYYNLLNETNSFFAVSPYSKYFRFKKETKRNKVMNFLRFGQVKFQRFCQYFLDLGWYVNIKYFTKICLPLINRLNLVYSHIHVREIFRYSEECCQILTF